MFFLKRKFRLFPWFLAMAVLVASIPIGRLTLPLDRVSYPGGDVGQMIWNIYHSTESLASGLNPYASENVTYPYSSNLTQHTLAAGFAPLGIVSRLLFSSELYPFVAFNIAMAFSLFANFIIFYILLRRLSISDASAAVASIIYSFTNYIFLHHIHLNLIPAFIFPTIGCLLLRFIKNPGYFVAFLLGSAVSAAMYLSEYAVFAIFALAVYFLANGSLGLAWLKVNLRYAAACIVFFLILVSPFVLNFIFGVQVERVDPRESSIYSANLLGFFIPDPIANPAYAFVALGDKEFSGIGGFEAFLGFPLFAFAMIGIINFWHKKIIRQFFFLGVFFLLLSMGDVFHVGSRFFDIPMPFDALKSVPPFDNFRTPVRFVIVASFFLTIVAAFGLDFFASHPLQKNG